MQGQKNSLLGEAFKVSKEIELLALGQANGLSGDVLERYINFMSIRFPQPQDWHYMDEWAERFATGHPEDWCDDKSKQVLDNITFLFLAIPKNRGFKNE